MPLPKAELVQLKGLIKTEVWDVLLKVLAQYIDDIEQQPVDGMNEFMTLKNLHTKQGKIEGIKEFFERIERQDKI